MNEVEEKAITRLKQIQYSYLKDELDLAIEIVLNLIEKQQVELEKKDKLNIIRTARFNMKLRNKDKIIDEMSEYIGKEDASEIFCDEKIECDENCQECVKQYFKKKISR